MTVLECGCETMAIPMRYQDPVFDWPMDQHHPTLVTPGIWFYWCSWHKRWTSEKALAPKD